MDHLRGWAAGFLMVSALLLFVIGPNTYWTVASWAIHMPAMFIAYDPSAVNGQVIALVAVLYLGQRAFLTALLFAARGTIASARGLR